MKTPVQKVHNNPLGMVYTFKTLKLPSGRQNKNVARRRSLTI